MQFSRQVTEAASRVLQESYPKGINLNDFQKLRQFRTALCQITGQNPNLAYKLETIRELIKLNGWLNGNKVIPYSTSSDSVEKKAPSQSAPLPVQSDAVKELERYRNDYCVWFVKRYGNSFESYWQILKTIVNEASKNGIVDKTLDLDDLKRIKNDLFALPKYNPKHFSARESYLLALNSFINFWTDVFTKEEPPKVEANDVADASDDEQEPEKPEVDPEIKAMLLKDFEARRDEYYQWFVDRYSDSFNDYWQKLEKVVDDAIELGILDDFLDADALEKIQTELFALPQYECKPFSSKWIYPRALKRFAQFWNDKPKQETEAKRQAEATSPSEEKAKTTKEQVVEAQTDHPVAEEDSASIDAYKDDFCRWLSRQGYSRLACDSYWEVLKSAFVDAVAFGFVNDSFVRDDLNKIKTDLLSLPEYQAEVFPSRADCLFALKRFTEFLNERSVDSWKSDYSPTFAKSKRTEEDEYSDEQDAQADEEYSDNDEESRPFEDFKDDFCNWLASRGLSESSSAFYWNCFINISNEAFKRGIISEPVDDVELRKIEKKLLALPEYQADVYPARNNVLTALRYFIQFWDDDQAEEDEKSSSDEVSVSFDEYRNDFFSWLKERNLIKYHSGFYWNLLINVLTDAYKKEIISEFIDVDELRKIETDLFSLRAYQEDVFPSRSNSLSVLRRFIQFWDEGSTEEKENDYSVTDNSSESQDEESSSDEDSVTFADYKGDFVSWLKKRNYSESACNVYWELFIGVLTDAYEKGIISEPVDVDKLKKIEKNLFSPPPYKGRVRPARDNRLTALRYFIEFWDDDSFEENEVKSSVTDNRNKESTNGEKAERFGEYKDDYCKWLRKRGLSEPVANSYWACFTKVLNDAHRRNIVSEPTKREDLRKIEKKLFSLPQYKSNVFPLRNKYLNALRLFINFLNYKLVKEPAYYVGSTRNNREQAVQDSSKRDYPNKREQAVQDSPEEDYPSFESYRDDYVQWLKRQGFSPSASKLFGSYLTDVINAAIKNKLIVDSFDGDDLIRIEAELFALPEYQVNVFPWRNSYMNALRKFIDFWNEDSDEETFNDHKEDPENEASEKPRSVKFNKWDFTSDLEPFKLEIEKRTVEVTGGWKGLYVALLEQCNSTYKRLFRKYYNRELSDYQNGLRRLPTFFTSKPVGGAYVCLSDGKYVNINLTPDMFIDNLKRLLSTCVVYPKDVRAFFSKKARSENSPTNEQAALSNQDVELEEIKGEYVETGDSSDNDAQDGGAAVRKTFVEWLSRKIPSAETLKEYKEVLPDIEKFCQNQTGVGFVLFETFDFKVVEKFARRERISFRTTIPPYAFSILKLYERFLKERDELFQFDVEQTVRFTSETNAAPKVGPSASSAVSDGFSTRRLGEPWLEPAKKVIEQTFPDKKICGYAELKNFRRLLQEEANDPNVAFMSKMRENALFRALNVSYVESAAPDRPRGSLPEADSTAAPKTVDVSTPQKLKQAVMLVLNRQFSHGIDVYSDYDLSRFRENWRKSPYALSLDDYDNDKLGALIVSAGIRFQGRVYTINRKAWTFITDALKKATNDALPIIYMSTFFESHKTELNRLSCHNYQFLSFLVEKHMMKDLVGYEFRDGRIVREHEENENETIKSEILRVWGDRKGVNVYWLKNQLHYVPLMEIERVLKQEPCFVYEKNAWYRIEDIFDEKYKRAKPEQTNVHIDQETIPVAQPEATPFSDFQIDQEAVLRILQKYYDNGFLYKSVVSQWQFIDYAEADGEQIFKGLNLKDENVFKNVWKKITEILKRIATRVDDEYYLLSNETKEIIRNSLDDAFKTRGFSVVYSQPLFETLQYEDKLPYWIGEEQLIELIKIIYDGIVCNDSVRFKRITPIQYQYLSEKDLVLMDVNQVWADDFILSYEQLQERLPYIPFDDKVKFFLSLSNSGFIFNGRGYYGKREYVEIPDSLKKEVLNFVKEGISTKGFVVLQDIPLGDLKYSYEEATEDFLRTTLYEKCLMSFYDRTGNYISNKGTKVTLADLLDYYQHDKEEISFASYLDFYRQNSSGNVNNEIAQISLEKDFFRLSKDKYVRKNKLNINIDDVDSSIDFVIGNRKYLPLKAFVSFAGFPEIGFPWNLFVLESFCSQFSRKFRYDVLARNSSNVGAVIRKTYPCSYEEVMIDVLASSDIDLNKNDALEFLLYQGYIGKKIYKNIDGIIQQAARQRESLDV